MTCAKCKRELRPWDLDHRGCSPKDWFYCISTDPKRVQIESSDSK